MVFTTTMVLLHSATPKGFDDEVIDGKFYNFGVQTLAALKAHKTIDVVYPAEDSLPREEMIIPYHAVLSWSVTKEEGEYTKPEDDFCKSESTPTGDITLVDGTYEFVGSKGLYTMSADLDKCYNPSEITVVMDGTKTILPYYGEHDGFKLYGECDENYRPVFDTYPVSAAMPVDGSEIVVQTSTVGNHTVKVTVPSGSEVECSGE